MECGVRSCQALSRSTARNGCTADSHVNYRGNTYGPPADDGRQTQQREGQTGRALKHVPPVGVVEQQVLFHRIVQNSQGFLSVPEKARQISSSRRRFLP